MSSKEEGCIRLPSFKLILAKIKPKSIFTTSLDLLWLKSENIFVKLFKLLIGKTSKKKESKIKSPNKI